VTASARPLPLIDSHCHLDFEDFAHERAQVIDRARAEGVLAFVSIGAGADLGPARAALALAEAEPDVFATVGIHPHDAARMTEEDWDALGTMARRPRVVGVGETGLDFHYDHSPREAQAIAFRRFIALARDVKKPIVCHIRDAHAEAQTILRDEQARDVGGVIHCFTGTPAEARVYLDLGFHVSFSGIITFKNAGEIRAAALLVPWERALIETDAPYLAPIPFRGKRNEPAYIVKTLEALAAAKGGPIELAAEHTTRNARRLFALPPGQAPA
jgi:TatD DNase family protein